MNQKLAIGRCVVALLFSGVLIAPAVAQPQNVLAASSGRKVRSKVVPAYPDIARTAHITGKVKIGVTISTDGRVIDTKVVGGSPVLVDAAIDAVDKWHFEPAPSETNEVIEFEFDGTN